MRWEFSNRTRSSCCWPTSTCPASSRRIFCATFARQFPHVVIIVITGYGSIEGAVEATKIGAFDYLTKPIVDDEIRVVVEKAVRQQSLLFENQTLRQQLDLRFGLENIVGHDYRMLKIFDLVERGGRQPNDRADAG